MRIGRRECFDLTNGNIQGTEDNNEMSATGFMIRILRQLL